MTLEDKIRLLDPTADRDTIIVLHPLRRQFIADEFGSILCNVGVLAVAAYCRYIHNTLAPYVLVLGIFLSLCLLYRFIFLTQTTYTITSEQLKYEYGVFSRHKDFIELYRVVDYIEQRSFFQILMGLKTVSIYSGDHTCPRLDLTGIDSHYRMVNIIRLRSEVNKQKRNIHEFTNTK